jgi:carbon monoxide dehydrogenase subunit G
MHIEQKFTVSATREQVWKFLLDAPRVGRCMPGVESVETTGPHSFKVVVSVRIGPVKPRFQGAVEMTELQPPEHIRLQLDWRDSVTGSKVSAPTQIRLDETAPEAVTVTVAGDIAVLGILGKYGQPIAERKAAEIAQEFAARMQAELASDG